MQSGNEPPLHLHQECDVVLYVLEGEMDVYCGTEVRSSGTPLSFVDGELVLDKGTLVISPEPDSR
jgi:mannose-6-phosphate isomerase-like protein (cupin superfamily)